MATESFTIGELHIVLHHTAQLTNALIEWGPAREVIGRAQDRDPARALGQALLDARTTIDREVRGGAHGPG